MSSWSSGTLLVAERGIVERLRSRSFRLVTALLLVASIAAVTLPQFLGQRATTYSVATVGPTQPDLAVALTAAGRSAGFTVTYLPRLDETGVRGAVRDGDATVGLVGDKLYARPRGDGGFSVLVAQTVVSVETSRRMSELGLTPRQIARLQAVQPPQQIQVGPVYDEGRAAVGFAVGMILYVALTFAGSAIATAVAVEKSTRISEVLLAVLRPSQAMAGTVMAVGTVFLAQLLVLAAPLVIAPTGPSALGLPAVAAEDIVLGLMWFLLGFVLFAFAFAATGALVDKVTEVNTAVAPLLLALIGGYLIALLLVTNQPEHRLSVASSIFPLTAPITMPIRWATGEVPLYQLLLAIGLTAATAVLMFVLASSVYQRALVITGHRVRLRELRDPLRPGNPRTR
jgi:ABC-2 type transport system permease protein